MTQWSIQRFEIFDQQKQEMVHVQTRISVTVNKQQINALLPLVTWANDTQGPACTEEHLQSNWYHFIFYHDQKFYKFGKKVLRKDPHHDNEATYEFNLYMNNAVYAQFVLAWGKQPIYNDGYLEY